MCNDRNIYRSWSRILCALLLVGSLLAGCAAPSGGQTQPPETTTPTTAPAASQDTQPDVTEPEEMEDESLLIFRQTMVETPQLFAAAYFGYVSPEAEPFAVMQEAAPQLCADLPYLLMIGEDRVLGEEGLLFCIVPADENASVAVNRVRWNGETEAYETGEVLYRSDRGRPILVLTDAGSQGPDTQVTITDSNGSVAVWYPHMDTDYVLGALYNDEGESLIFDFTSYEELPDPNWDQGIDSSALEGKWELAWTEVEGDRIEAAPGVCTIDITPDGNGAFLVTLTDRDFPDWNVTDREMQVVPGELYPGCGNDRWVAEVWSLRGEPFSYEMTLLADDTLLVQTFWEMDGMIMVSTAGYRRVS